MTAKKTAAAQKTEAPATEPTVDPTYSDAPEGFSAEYVEQVQAAEAAAQRSVVNFPDGKTPDALTKALARRVEVNLAQADGRTVTRVGGTDPKVRDLESPYSKRKTASA